MQDLLIKVSKYLSFVLRHKPESIGLRLDAEGWAEVDELIEKADIQLSKLLIENVVTTNDKQRFALSPDGFYIRANQGHSIKVNLGLEPIEPPEILYHGTAERFLDTIMIEGLRPQNRQYVHLSNDIETATKVGQRYGKPVILQIPALLMHKKGHEFLQAHNGVWLTGHVLPEFIDVKA